jgi:hypothetical protein
MDQSVMTILFIAAVLVFAGILMTIITLTKRSPRQLDVEKYRSQWMAIEQQLRRDDASSYQLCVLNADKLLDKALQDRQLPGNTMGERMKAAQSRWSNANVIWSAHKLRNQIAHDSDVVVNYESARRALGAFKQGLKDMGAI